MKYSIKIKPKSRKGNFIFSLRLSNGGKNRLRICLRKINHYFYASHQGNIRAIIDLQSISSRIDITISYFNKEKNRLANLRKNIDLMINNDTSYPEYQFKIANKIEFKLVSLINLFDEIALSLEIGRLSGRLSNKSAKLKEKHFSKKIMGILMDTSYLKYSPLDIDHTKLDRSTTDVINDAITSSSMPNFIGDVKRKLDNIIDIKEVV